MFDLIYNTLVKKKDCITTAYFDNFEIHYPVNYNIIPHKEKNIIEFSSENKLDGDKTIFINLSNVSGVKFT